MIEMGDVGVMSADDVMEGLLHLMKDEGLTPQLALDDIRQNLNVYGDRFSGIAAYALLSLCEEMYQALYLANNSREELARVDFRDACEKVSTKLGG